METANPTATTDSVPFFTIKAALRRMGDISALVFNVISAKKDAELLKMLFSKLGESEHNTRWLFVPTGLHLIASPDLVKASLKHQNEYIQNITAVAIEGISAHTMENKGTTGVSLADAICHHIKGLESIERTTLLRQRGRWLIIVQKTVLPQVREQLAKHILPTLESRGNPTFPGIPISIAGSLIKKLQ